MSAAAVRRPCVARPWPFGWGVSDHATTGAAMSEGDSTRHRLEQAAEGLTYTSESDRPFDPFELPGGAAGWPYAVEEFARRVGAPAGAPLEERTLQRFFAPHIESTDQYDRQTQALRPRYEALRGLLASSLRDVRVFRIGRIEIDCYVVGAADGGKLMGLHTVAVET
jgi:hypothetical protein